MKITLLCLFITALIPAPVRAQVVVGAKCRTDLAALIKSNTTPTAPGVIKVWDPADHHVFVGRLVEFDDMAVQLTYDGRYAQPGVRISWNRSLPSGKDKATHFKNSVHVNSSGRFEASWIDGVRFDPTAPVIPVRLSEVPPESKDKKSKTPATVKKPEKPAPVGLTQNELFAVFNATRAEIEKRLAPQQLVETATAK